MNKPCKVNKLECANCGVSDKPLLACARCVLVHYCSRECQKEHWKNDHKQRCVPLDKRKPELNAEKNENECAICLVGLNLNEACTLLCSHKFHRKCIKEMNTLRLPQLCPLCRANSPIPEKLVQMSVAKYERVHKSILRGKSTFTALSKEESDTMQQVLREMIVSADQGYSIAQFILWRFYTEGIIEKNPIEAARWLLMAGEQGLVEAQYAMGVSFRLESNFAESVKWFLKASIQGHSESHYNLGEIYHQGMGDIKRNLKVAKIHLTFAATAGNFEACADLGSVCYELGEETEAFEWVMLGALKGNVDAQMCLAVMYYHGQGCFENKSEAMRWYRKSGHQDHAIAQCFLAEMYFEGDGCPIDKAEAMRWFTKSAKQGYSPAQVALDEIAKDEYSETVHPQPSGKFERKHFPF